MTRVQWGKLSSKTYNNGIDRGVLYTKDNPGVSWDGLVKVTETTNGSDTDQHYLDGVNYHNSTKNDEYQATLEAYTYPDEFSKINGDSRGAKGIEYTQQDRETFNFTYRSTFSNESELNLGYKIHLIYNALATPTVTTHTTRRGNVELETLTWDIITIPNIMSSRKPTAHLIINSLFSDKKALTDLENILYGTSSKQPRMVTTEELLDIFDDWPRLEIIPEPNTGLAKLSLKKYGDLKGDPKKGLYSLAEDTRLKSTNTSGVSRLDI